MNRVIGLVRHDHRLDLAHVHVLATFEALDVQAARSAVLWCQMRPLGQET